MEFLVYKQVQTERAEDLGRYMDMGFTVQRVRAVAATATNAGGKAAPKKVIRARRRKYLKVTPDLVGQMTDLRKKGLIWRVIGRRYGVSAARAWQIVERKGGR